MTRLPIVAVALAVSGCLQAAPEPLTPAPEVALDAALVRDWRCVTSGEDGTLRLALTETAPGVYRLRFELPGEDPMIFEGHASAVDGTTVLSVRDLSEKDKPTGWSFAIPTLHRPEVLELRYAQIEELEPPPRAQVAASLASGKGLVQACVCVPLRPES
jgi:hypothetical protein